MITLEKLVAELKLESVNEIVASKGFLGIHFGRKHRKGKHKSDKHSGITSDVVTVTK